MRVKKQVERLNKEALTIKEVSLKCKVEYRTVQHWIAKGLLPISEVKGKVLIDPLDVPTYIRLKTFRKR